MGTQGHSDNSDHSDNSEESSESERIVFSRAVFISCLSFGILYLIFGCFYIFAIRNQHELRNISKYFHLMKYICGASNIILVEIHLLENAVHIPCLLDLFCHNSILAMIGIPYMYQVTVYMVCISDDREVRTYLKNKGTKALYLTCFLVLTNYMIFFSLFFTSHDLNCLPNELSEVFNIILHLVFIVLIYWLRRDLPWKFDALNISRELNIFCVTWISCEVLIKIDSIIGVSTLIHFHNFHTVLRLGMLVALLLISFIIPYHSRKQKRSAVQPEQTGELVIVKSKKKEMQKYSLACNDQSILMKAMQSDEKYHFLLDHSRKNFYPELILFLKAVYDFLSLLENDKEENQLFDCFKRIVEDFIRPQAPFEINISESMRKSIEVYLDKIKFIELPLRSKFEIFADILTETEELFWRNNIKQFIMNKLRSVEDQIPFDQALWKKKISKRWTTQ